MTSSKVLRYQKTLKVGGTILVLQFATPVTERLVEHFLQHQKVLKSSGPHEKVLTLDPRS